MTVKEICWGKMRNEEKLITDWMGKHKCYTHCTQSTEMKQNEVCVYEEIFAFMASRYFVCHLLESHKSRIGELLLALSTNALPSVSLRCFLTELLRSFPFLLAVHAVNMCNILAEVIPFCYRCSQAFVFQNAKWNSSDGASQRTRTSKNEDREYKERNTKWKINKNLKKKNTQPE